MFCFVCDSCFLCTCVRCRRFGDQGMNQFAMLDGFSEQDADEWGSDYKYTSQGRKKQVVEMVYLELHLVLSFLWKTFSQIQKLHFHLNRTFISFFFVIQNQKMCQMSWSELKANEFTIYPLKASWRFNIGLDYLTKGWIIISRNIYLSGDYSRNVTRFSSLLWLAI